MALACAAASAPAQVVRCTDAATGQVTYTDGPCRRGDAAREVAPRKTPEELQREREQAAEALARKHERQLHEERLRAQAVPDAATPPPPPDPARSPQCLRARQQLQDALAAAVPGRGLYDDQARLEAAQQQADLACLTPAEQARVRAARPYPAVQGPAPAVVIVPPRPRPTPAPRREITHCNVFRCYDKQGNVYPR